MAIHVNNDKVVEKLTEETNAQLAEESKGNPVADSTPAEVSEETEAKAKGTEEQTLDESEDSVEAPEKAEKPSADEDGESDKRVPYSRFKEVNDKLRSLESAYQDLVSRRPDFGQDKAEEPQSYADMDAGQYAEFVKNQAISSVRQEIESRKEAEKQEAEALKAYPELDSSNEGYSQEFEEAVASMIIANRQGKPKSEWMTAKQAADKVAKLGGLFKAQGEKQALDEVKTKSGVGETAQGKSSKPSPEDMTLEELEAILPKSDGYFRSVKERENR